MVNETKDAAFVPKWKAMKVMNSMAFLIFDLAFKMIAYPHRESAKYWRQDLDAFTRTLCKYHNGYLGRKNFSYQSLMERIWDENIVTYGLMTFEQYGPTHGPFDLNEVKRTIEKSITEIVHSRTEAPVR